jgi:TnpA family transposase
MSSPKCIWSVSASRRASERYKALPSEQQDQVPVAGTDDRRTINIKAIRAHWNEILRLATSIKQGTVTASLMLRKLSSYPRQNGVAVALRELGRIERTLFILSWLQSVELRLTGSPRHPWLSTPLLAGLL